MRRVVTRLASASMRRLFFTAAGMIALILSAAFAPVPCLAQSGPAANQNATSNANGNPSEATPSPETKSPETPASNPPPDTPKSGEKSSDQKPTADKPAGSTSASAPKETEAERYARLRRAAEETQKQLEDARQKLERAQADYDRLDAEVQKLTTELEEKSAALEKAKQANATEDVARLESEVNDLAERKRLATEQRDLVFKERKTISEQIPTLEKLLKSNKDAVAALEGPPGDKQATTKPAEMPAEKQPAQGALAGNANAAVQAPAQPANPAASGEVQPSANSGQPAQATPPVSPPVAGALPGTAPAQPGTTTPPKPVSPELKKATEELEAKQAKAQEAAEQVTTKEQQIENLRKLIKLDEQLLGTAHQKRANALQSAQTLREQARNKWADGAKPDEINKLWAQAEEANQRYVEAQKEVDDIIARVDKRQTELDQLQSERIAAMKTAEKERKAAEQAQQKKDELENPFSLENLRTWVVTRGPRVLAIILGVVALLWLVGVIDRRVSKRIAARSDRGSMVERENRARTLVQVIRNAASVVIVASGFIMLLGETGIDLAPILGGAAVVGLAVAFGAQNLVRDYFSGFMILLENQYGVNDVIRIGDTAGLVERITLRITILRDLEGIVHFVPNGEITRVSNMTHGWSRALFDIGVAYKEDVNQVMSVLVQVANELRAEPEFKLLILEPPEMLGVNAFADSAVVIKFFIKTRPLQQWKVKREMLRRIKMRFDELGIEIPFPHRTVYHRYEESNGSAEHHRGSEQPWSVPAP
ncbi:MAG: mechanosensitive ion channel [Phycisphaerae bacterium]|nr:mechanosensitive ion channel [Phycisphaerae bacterium]